MTTKFFETKEELITLIQSSPLRDDRIRFGDMYYNPLDGMATYYINKDYNTYIFTHESAHMIDFFQRGEINRLGQNNYGFDRLSYDEYGNATEPTTTQGLLRECRAHAIQLRLLEILDLPQDPKEFFKDVIRLINVQYRLADVWNVPPKNGYSRQLKRKFIDNFENEKAEEAWNAYSEVSAMEQKQYALKEMVRTYNNNQHDDLLNDWDGLWRVMDMEYTLSNECPLKL